MGDAESDVGESSHRTIAGSTAAKDAVAHGTSERYSSGQVTGNQRRGNQPALTKRHDIQVLRGIAVALVVAAHAGITWLAGGYIGVDVFFVVSGYVITRAMLEAPDRTLKSRLADFYRRRIVRLVPAATVVLTTTLLASAWLLGPQMDARLPSDARWAALFSANVNLINGRVNYFMPGVDPSPVIHFWSLGVEEQFYLLYPLLLLIPIALLPRRFGKVSALMVLGIAVAASALWSATSTSMNPVVAYYSPFTRFWELGLGGMVALLPVIQMPNRMRQLLIAAAFIVIAAAAVTFDDTTSVPGVAAWLPCGAAAVCVHLGDGTAPTSAGVMTRPLAALGDISYSVYLWHFVWLLLPLQVIAVSHPQLVGTIPIPAATIGAVFGAIVCGWLSYRWIENPIRHARLLKDDGVSAALLLVCCVLVVWNVSIYVQSHTLGA